MIRPPKLQGDIMRHGELILRRDDQGSRHWTCECSLYLRQKWCNHLAELYMAKDPKDLSIEPAVVVFAKDPWLIVPCRISNIMPEFSEVFVLVNDELRSIGYIESDTASLWHVRQLILEWLPSIHAVYPSYMTCDESFHDTNSGWGKWRRHLESPVHNWPVKLNGRFVDRDELAKLIYTEDFSLLDSSVCLTCDEAKFMDTEDVF